MEAEEALAAYRSSRRLIGALAGLNVLTTVGASYLVAVDGGWRGTWMTAAAGAYAVASLLLAWLILHVSGRSLVIHPDWFEYRTSTESLQARWDQVDTLYATPAGLLGRRGLFGRYEYRFEVYGRGVDAGTAVGADADLGRIVAERTLPHLFDRAVARLRAGRPVRFGPVTVEPASLAVRAPLARRIDLDDLGACRLAHRRLVLEVKGRRRPVQVSLRRMPNARVLLDLLERRPDWEAKGARRPGQRPKKALTKNQRLAGRSAMRRVR